MKKFLAAFFVSALVSGAALAEHHEDKHHTPAPHENIDKNAIKDGEETTKTKSADTKDKKSKKHRVEKEAHSEEKNHHEKSSH